MPTEEPADARALNEFEYEKLMESYHNYFPLVAKGISIYLLIIGACLSLPYTLKLGSNSRVMHAYHCLTREQ